MFTIELEPEHWAEKILDLGGGGEAVISRLYPQTSIALDRRLDELLEAPDRKNPLAADALQMPFSAGSFYACTSFFSLMYFAIDDLPALAAELSRVLAPGAIFRLWEAEISQADPFLADLKIVLPKEQIRVQYGVYDAGRQQNSDLFQRVFGGAGLSRVQKQNVPGLIIGTWMKSK